MNDRKLVQEYAILVAKLRKSEGKAPGILRSMIFVIALAETAVVKWAIEEEPTPAEHKATAKKKEILSEIVEHTFKEKRMFELIQKHLGNVLTHHKKNVEQGKAFLLPKIKDALENYTKLIQWETTYIERQQKIPSLQTRIDIFRAVKYLTLLVTAIQGKGLRNLKIAYTEWEKTQTENPPQKTRAKDRPPQRKKRLRDSKIARLVLGLLVTFGIGQKADAPSNIQQEMTPTTVVAHGTPPTATIVRPELQKPKTETTKDALSVEEFLQVYVKTEGNKYLLTRIKQTLLRTSVPYTGSHPDFQGKTVFAILAHCAEEIGVDIRLAIANLSQESKGEGMSWANDTNQHGRDIGTGEKITRPARAAKSAKTELGGGLVEGLHQVTEDTEKDELAAYLEEFKGFSQEAAEQEAKRIIDEYGYSDDWVETVASFMKYYRQYRWYKFVKDYGYTEYDLQKFVISAMNQGNIMHWVREYVPQYEKKHGRLPTVEEIISTVPYVYKYEKYTKDDGTQGLRRVEDHHSYDHEQTLKHIDYVLQYLQLFNFGVEEKNPTIAVSYYDKNGNIVRLPPQPYEGKLSNLSQRQAE